MEKQNDILKLNEMEIAGFQPLLGDQQIATMKCEIYGKALINARNLNGMYTVDFNTWTLVKQEQKKPELKIEKKE